MIHRLLAPPPREFLATCPPHQSRPAARAPGRPTTLLVALLGLMMMGCDRPATSNQPVTEAKAAPPRSDDSREIVAQLASINVTNGPITATQAAEWRRDLGELVKRGPAAVPALEEFFDRNLDLNFAVAGNEAVLGVATLRLGLMDALEKIGGQESLRLARKIFGTTADPIELLTLASFLEQAEPGQHRAEFVTAARETLALASSGNWDSRDVAPLFAMLQHFGSTSDLVELERYASQWFAYVAITIGRWPDGAGLPILTKLAQNAEGKVTLGREFYWRMLAEAAIHTPAAAEALVAEVKRNQIAVDSWPGLGRTLGGNSLRLPDYQLVSAGSEANRPGAVAYHLTFGNQNFQEIPLPANAPPDELGARISLIDRLLDTTANPAALDALEAARINLSARLPKAR